MKAAARPCRHEGCRYLQPCPLHPPARRHAPSARLRRQEEPWRVLYQSQRWRRLRRTFLSEQPLCRHCEAQGRLVLAAVVDHIQPHRGDLSLFWDRSNWQGLCVSCHGTKTAHETWHRGRA